MTEPLEPRSLSRLLLIEDDDLGRDLLTLLLEGEGFQVVSAPSGDDALALLRQSSTPRPEAVLSDLQMPGQTGAPLARALRRACDPDTILLAMSATRPAAATLQPFDGFLLKPFTMPDLHATLSGFQPQPVPEPARAAIALNSETYALLGLSMGEESRRALYQLCLDDAERRIELMRLACEQPDATTYRRLAHAIKGASGMVGAQELCQIASEMEETGIHTGSLGTLDHFLAASLRLRGMLWAHEG